MSWDDLCGNKTLMAIRTDARHPFDANASGMAFQLKDEGDSNLTVFVFEDPSDGYRSSAVEPLIHKGSLYEFCDSPEYIRAPVLVRRWTESAYGDGADGVELIDTRNGKTILRVGTDNCGDYYPSYTCDWRPRDLAENHR